MATFDPKKEREKNKDEGIPAGDYLLVLKSFERKTARTSGKDYLRSRFQVIYGPAKGKSFFDSISLDTGNSGSMLRLSLLAEGCGRTEPFDLDSDADLRAALTGKPFKARVKRAFENGYTNNGIERYLVSEKDVSQREREIMDIWSMERQEEEDMGQGDGGPPISDGDFYGGGGGGRAPDDDIPF